MAVGPIHAGIIESGHFRFHVVGESILHVDLRLFYKHRGLERAAEGRTLEEGLAYAQRACAACAVSNAVAYAHAAESLLGLWPEPELARARTLLLELERLYNHLQRHRRHLRRRRLRPGQHGLRRPQRAGPSAQPESDRAPLPLRHHRGGGQHAGRWAGTLPPRPGASCAPWRDDARKAWHEVLFNASVQDRLVDVGVLSLDDVRRLGIVGPAARAAGVAVRCADRKPPPGLPGLLAGGAALGVG